MKKIKLGLRLNAHNRRKIAQAVVYSKMGSRMESLRLRIKELGREVYKAIFDLYGLGNLCADGHDPSTIMEGTLPVLSNLTITSSDRQHILNLEFGDDKPVPYVYVTGNMKDVLFNDLPMFEERVMAIFPLTELTRKQADKITQKMLEFLEEHKTLRTVIETAPELADIIPDEYCEEPTVGLSLDSILEE